MRIYGFRGYDWEADGYVWWFDEGNTFVPSIDPQVHLRTGTYPTFGPTVVNTMDIVGGFLILPTGAAGALDPEAAWQNLFKKLEIWLPTPGLIRAERNDGVLLTLTGILAVPNSSSRRTINSKDATFVCAKPFWEAQGYMTGGGFL